MNHSDYTIEALKTWTAPLRGTEQGRQYLMYGLLSEFGEVADVLKKQIRNGTPLEDVRNRLVDEIGDVLWYAAILRWEGRAEATVTVPEWVRIMTNEEAGYDFVAWLQATGITLEECRIANITKLASRAARGVITGEGGSR